MTMTPSGTRHLLIGAALCAAALSLNTPSISQTSAFHGAPDSARASKNPLSTQPQAAQSGQQVFARTCANCHGPSGQGNGNVPALASGASKSASDGELFWYMTKGDINNGMPSWASLPEDQRWQVVAYIRTLQNPGAAPTHAPWDPAPNSVENAPAPKPPFTDYRYEKPGLVRKISLNDLPEPFATDSAGNGPNIAPRPQGVWPQVPQGFKVEQYATGFDRPRLIRTAPNGDFFVAESQAGDIKVVRGLTADGKAELIA